MKKKANLRAITGDRFITELREALNGEHELRLFE
jgi:hypothetical protein